MTKTLGPPCAAHVTFHPWKKDCYEAWQQFLGEHFGTIRPDVPYWSTGEIWNRWNIFVEQRILWAQITMDSGNYIVDSVMSAFQVFPWELGL